MLFCFYGMWIAHSRHSIKLVLPFLSFMNLFTSHKPNEKPLAEEKSLIEQSFANVHYGKDGLQIMDIFLPVHRSVHHTKSLILIHGGGWISGSKAEFSAHIDSFKKRLPDYAIFNFNYRLVNGGNLFPTQENDVKAAIDFIVSNAGKYHVNKDKFVLLGVSAGAHLSLLQAYKYHNPKILAVVDYFGPTDLLAMYQNPWHPLVPLALQMITGTTPQKNRELFASSSPVTFVSPQSPPTLILHGGKDEIVDVSQSKALAAKLEEAGVVHQLEIYPSERHGHWYGNALISSFDHIEKFLKQHVK
ncbi:MAG: alpha/beta hydrolase [Chitinophagaceae bacterium]|nr:MAG: alpha/beta hydrolase [Chitinophagaceae bacterium]